METKLFTASGGSIDLKKYLPVNVNTSFSTLAPHLGLAEQNYIIPLLGKKLYNKIAAEEEPEESGSGSGSESGSAENLELWATLKDEVKFAVIHMAFYLGYPVLSVSISDAGAGSKVDETKRLFRRQEEKLERYFQIEGLNKLDKVLDLLYDNIEVFSDFEESDFYKDAKNTLIPDTKTFNKIYNINNSRLVFLKMKYYIKRVEDIELQHMIGRVFFKELLDADFSQNKYKEIISDIRSYIVHMAIAVGIGELKKQPTEKGLIFENSTNEGFNVLQVETSEIKQTTVFAKETAESYLSNAIYFMKQHPTDYPNFIDFAGTDAKQHITFSRDNTNKKTVFL